MLERALWEEALAEAGFQAGGAGPPRLSREDESALEAWVLAGYQADMDWMERTLPVRLDPGRFAPWARSVLVAGLRTPRGGHRLPGGGRVARYALGRDYHKVVKKKLRALRATLSRMVSPAALEARGAVDLHPVAERALAVGAGLGWIGKQGQLIHPAHGPWLLLGELFLSLELEPAPPLPGRCGTCRACLEACPTGALLAPGLVDAGRCISYWTIEARGLPPRELRPAFGEWFFGCDACLESCPWGRESPAAPPSPLHPLLEEFHLEDFLSLTPGKFDRKVRGTPLRRAGRAGLARNAAIAAANLGREDLGGALAGLLDQEPPFLRAAGAWALGRLGIRRTELERALGREGDPWVREEIEAALEGG